MMRYLLLLAELLLISSGNIAQIRSDYSNQSEEFYSLRNLLIEAQSVHSIGRDTVALLGFRNVATEFKVIAPVSVQVACYGTFEAEFDTSLCLYTIRAIEDSLWFYHDSMIALVHNYWLGKDSSYRANYLSLPVDTHLVYVAKDEYILLLRPGSNTQGSTLLLWFDQRLFAITFDEFLGKEGAGALSFFIEENLAFAFPQYSLQLTEELRKGTSPQHFLELHSAGIFSR